MTKQFIALFFVFLFLGGSAEAQTAQESGFTAIRAGRLIDPDTGTVTPDQIILVEGTTIREIGPNVTIPEGAEVIDLSDLSVLPGLVDAHNHLALTYKEEPESNVYYLTYVLGLHCASGDPGRVERHPDAFVRFHRCPGSRQQRELCRHGTSCRDRAGLGSRADDHQFGHHHRRDGRAVLSDTGDGRGTQHRLSGVPGCRHERRDREGHPAEHPLRRKGH